MASPNLSEVASGLAGSAVARQQSGLDTLRGIFEGAGSSVSGALSDVGDYFSRGFESGIGNTDFRSGIENIRSAVEGVEPGKFTEPAIAVGSPILGFVRNPVESSVIPQQFGLFGSPSQMLGLTSEAPSLADSIAKVAGEYAWGDRQGAQSSILQGTYQRRKSEFDAAVNLELTGIGDQYNKAIVELQDELAGYRGGLNGVNAAYSNYADKADAILKEAAEVDANPLPPSAVVAETGEAYDRYSEQMAATLGKIDSNGNKELAQAMAGEVRYMEDVLADGLRSGLMSQDEMHNLAGAEAQALANMAWKDDAYESERARFTLELEIQQQIKAKQDQIADARAEMDAALEAARAKFGDFEMSSDELWKNAFGDFLDIGGLNDVEKQQIESLWKDIMADPQSRVNYDTFKSTVMMAVNEENLARIGVLDEYDNWVATLQSQAEIDQETGLPNAAMATLEKINSAMGQPISSGAIKGIFDAASVFGLDVTGMMDDVPWDELEEVSDDKYQMMMDLWQHHDDFQRNYNDYVQEYKNSQATYKSGGQAPNNAANKNHPDYVYRRNVVAPHFAQQIQDVFPNFGVKIGGLRYIRPSDQVGGGKASNSDHQSGGAIDVYANSEAARKEIAAWARTQPGISMVIYEGNSAHEGHHVHLSFQLGHRI